MRIKKLLKTAAIAAITATATVSVCALPQFTQTVWAYGETSGTCGASATWRIEGDTLYIEGSGEVFGCNDPCNDYSITNVVIGKDITSIEVGAFDSCSNLTTVTFENLSSLESIGDCAFYHCGNLTTVTFENLSSLESIGNFAFYECSNLTTVTLENLSSLESIGNFAFCDCDIREMTIPASVESIGANAFGGNGNMTSITLPYRFSDMVDDGRLLLLPDGCEVNYTYLISFDANTTDDVSGTMDNQGYAVDGTVTLNANAFVRDGYNFVGWNTAADGLGTSYADGASISGLTGAALNLYAQWVSSSCGDNATWRIEGNTLYIEGSGDMDDYTNNTYSSRPWNDYSFTSVVIGKDITSIGDFAFKDCAITSLTFEEGSKLNSIGKGAFYDCSNLNTDPFVNCSSLQSIGDWAFLNCYGLTTVSFENCSSLQSIGDSAFNSCYGLTTVSFENCNSLQSIGYSTFGCCRYITTVIFDNCSKLESLDDYCFYECYDLTTVSFKNCNSLQSIGEAAFYYCDIREITIPGSVTSLEAGIFRDNENMTSITFPYSLDSQKSYFWLPSGCTINYSYVVTYNANTTDDVTGTMGNQCYAVDGTVTLNANAFVRDGYNFMGWNTAADGSGTSYTDGEAISGLTGDALNLYAQWVSSSCGESATWRIEGDTLYIEGSGEVFGCIGPSNDYSITNVVIGKDITSIRGGAFAMWSNLTTVTLENLSSLESIGNSAFCDCDIREMTIPASVESIGMHAFGDNENMTSITLPYRFSNMVDDGSLLLLPDGCTVNYTCLVSFNANTTDDVSGSMDNQGYAADGTVTLYENCFERYGYTFAGWNTAADGSGTAYADGASISGLTGENLTLYAQWAPGRLVAHSVGLSDYVGINFIMRLPEEVRGDAGAYMLFTLASGDEQIVTVADADFNASYAGYSFTCYVAAKEMADVVTAQLHMSDNSVGVEYTYSVKEYAEYMLAHVDDNTSYAEYEDLVKAMLNYGAYAQLYFGYNTDNLANSSLADEDKDVSAVTYESINRGYDKDTAEHLPDGVTFEGASLSLESAATLKLYFSGVEEENITASCTEGNCRVITSGEYTVVCVDEIYASSLKGNLVISLTINKTEGYRVTYSAMNYCYNVLSRDTTPVRTDALKDLIRAMYKYADEARNLVM
ncbi:MAG: leucine-rich repeat protein [Lachnospiraceae bacterium]|nr:leucine-rich repeat protein [Lachnospiraceae bacterium]